MTQATNTTTTPPTDPREADSPTVPGQSPEMARAIMAASLVPVNEPTVLQLGKHLADVERALYCFNEDHFPPPGKDACDAAWARMILEERAEGLRMVLGTMVATSLPEAVIQTALIAHFSERVSSVNGDRCDSAGEAIERLVFSVLPVVAAHADLNIEDMGWSDIVRLRPGRFAGVGVEA